MYYMLNSLFCNHKLKTFIKKSNSYSKCAKRLVATHSVCCESVKVYFKYDPRMGLIKSFPTTRVDSILSLSASCFHTNVNLDWSNFFQKAWNPAAFESFIFNIQ